MNNARVSCWNSMSGNEVGMVGLGCRASCDCGAAHWPPHPAPVLELPKSHPVSRDGLTGALVWADGIPGRWEGCLVTPQGSHSLIPGNCGYDSEWHRGLCGSDQVKDLETGR